MSNQRQRPASRLVGISCIIALTWAAAAAAAATDGNAGASGGNRKLQQFFGGQMKVLPRVPVSGAVQNLMNAKGDLYAVLYRGASSTELYAVSASSKYKTLTLRTPTGLPPTSASTFQFALSPISQDLFAINLTAPSKPQLLVLSKASGYKTITLKASLPIKDAKQIDTFKFLLSVKDDLFAIKYAGARSTEVTILSAASKYGKVVLQTPTSLPKSSASQIAYFMGEADSITALHYAGDASQNMWIEAVGRSTNYDAGPLGTPVAMVNLHMTTPGAYQFVNKWSGNSFFAVPN